MTDNAPNDGQDIIAANVTPTPTDEEAPSKGIRGSSESAGTPKPERESCGWRVYYWIGMLSALGLGAIIMFLVLKYLDSSSSTTVPDAPIFDDVDTSNTTDSGLPLLQESTNFPLPLCSGDCDTDNDCDVNLRCFQRNAYEAVPGCEGGLEDDSRTDYCIPIVLPQIEESSVFPLGLCQGDCDTNDDCQEGLSCFQRSANDVVPGCQGGSQDYSNTDYCIPEQTEGIFLKQLGQRLLGGKGDNFGSSISLSQDGTILAIGAIDAGSTGYVELYELINEMSWKFVTTVEGDEIGSEFGHSISLSGDGKFLAVGSPRSSSGSIRNVGKVLVYELLLNEIDKKWNIVGEIESDNPNIGAYLGFEFGQSVALSSDGSVLAVSEPLYGRIAIYRFFNGFWPKIGNPIQLGDLAGRSLSLSDDGSRIAISGENQLEVFEFNGDDWAQSTQSQTTANIFQNGAASVVLSGDGTIVAMASVDKDVGEIVIQTFQYPMSSSWVSIGAPIRLVSTDSTVPNIVLSRDGKVLLVGDPRYGDSGRIVLFSYDESRNEWQQVDSVVGRAYNELFGASLAIAQDASGNVTVAIGSPYPTQAVASFGSAVVYKTEYGKKAAETSSPTTSPTAAAPAILEQVDSWRGVQGAVAGRDVCLSKDGKVFAYSVTEIGGNGYVESFRRNNAGHWERLDRVQGNETDANFGQSISLSADGKMMAVGVPDGNPNGLVRIYSFNETLSTWIQTGSDIVGDPFDPNNYIGGDGFGYSVSLSSSGLLVAIGSPYGTASIHVFGLEGDVWVRRGVSMRYSLDPALEGWSVAISEDGNDVAVGAPTNEEVSDEAGVCVIYKYIDGQWQRRGQPLFGDARHDLFGTSVSLSSGGDIVAVGSMNNDNENGENSGYVRVHRYNAVTDTWESLGQPILGDASSDRFGVSVALSNDGMKVAIGATGHGLGGQVRLFQFDEESTSWRQIGPAINGNVENGAFGASVSMSDDAGKLTLVAGAPETMEETRLGLVRDLVGEVFLYEGI